MNQATNKKKQKRSKTLIHLNKINDSGNGSSETTTNISPSPVDLMTSRELQYDINARIGSIKRTLKDTVRIDNFKEAILHNKHLFKGKRVLNIGCGIGIYALFAAKAEASKVYAVDNSNVIYYTQQIVEANGYSKTIEVIKGKITEIELPVTEVDIIVSDWMGNALFYESTCHDVIFARDKWLKKTDGLIFPDEAKLFVVAFEDPLIKNRNIEWWRRVYGFDMSCLREEALREPRIHAVKPEQVLSKQYPIKTLNLNTATLEDLKVRNKFILPIIKAGCIHGIALYFHIYFTKSHVPFGFSTDPWSLSTEWLQTKLFFDDFLVAAKGAIYYGGIEFYPAKSPNNFRDMILNLEMFKGDPTAIEEEVIMSWHFKLNTDAMDSSEASNEKVFPAKVNDSNYMLNNKNLKTENVTKKLSMLDINSDTQAKCLNKNKIRDNCKSKQPRVNNNSQISIQNKTIAQSTTIDLKTNEMIKNYTNNSNLTKTNFKQYNNNHKFFFKKNPKLDKNNFGQENNNTVAQISTPNQSKNTLNTTITIGDCNYPCRKIRHNNKCKSKQKVNNNNNHF